MTLRSRSDGSGTSILPNSRVDLIIISFGSARVSVSTRPSALRPTRFDRRVTSGPDVAIPIDIRPELRETANCFYFLFGALFILRCLYCERAFKGGIDCFVIM